MHSAVDKLMSATEIISDGPEGIILESVLEGCAEYYSADLSEKVIRGMTENALKGKFTGGAIPFGYIINADHRFEIDPLTAPFVAETFQRYNDGQTMQLVRDDAAMESIIAKVMELQDRENTNLPLYEKQLRDAESGIQNMLNAIQAGILTSSTKERLEQLEETKRELEARIAEEKLAKPKVTEEFIRFWLLRFRKLDMSLKDQRQALVDTFINAIYLYDDKVLITFNYKEGTQTVTFGEATEVASEGNGSDLDCFTALERLST